VRPMSEIWKDTLAMVAAGAPLHIVANVGPLTLFPPGEAPVDWAPCFPIDADTKIVHHEATSMMAREQCMPDGSYQLLPMPVRRNGRLCEPYASAWRSRPWW
jgi:hypothetical protein